MTRPVKILIPILQRRKWGGQKDKTVYPNSYSWQDAQPGLAKLNPSFLYSRPYCFLKIDWSYWGIKAGAYQVGKDERQGQKFCHLS